MKGSKMNTSVPFPAISDGVKEALDSIPESLMEQALEENPNTPLLVEGSEKLTPTEKWVLRYHILVGSVFPRLEGKLSVFSDSKDGVYVELDPSAGEVEYKRDPNAQLPSWAVEKVLSATGDDRAAYINDLFLNGWTTVEIGRAVGKTRQWASALKVKGEQLNNSFDVPERPKVEVRSPFTSDYARTVKYIEQITNTVGEDRLVDLMNGYANLPVIRRGTPQNSPDRAIASKFWKSLNDLVEDTGVSLYSLSQIMGLSPHTLRHGLTRYGFIKGSPSVRNTTPQI